MKVKAEEYFIEKIKQIKPPLLIPTWHDITSNIRIVNS